MATASPAAVQGFAPLVPLLRLVDPIKLDETRQRLRRLERKDLLAGYQAAFAAGRRVQAYVMAQALVANSVPPFVWH